MPDYTVNEDAVKHAKQLIDARLNVLPTRAEHVLPRVDQFLRMPDRVLVHRVAGHERILADLRQRLVGAANRTSLFSQPYRSRGADCSHSNVLAPLRIVLVAL